MATTLQRPMSLISWSLMEWTVGLDGGTSGTGVNKERSGRTNALHNKVLMVTRNSHIAIYRLRRDTTPSTFIRLAVFPLVFWVWPLHMKQYLPPPLLRLFHLNIFWRSKEVKLYCISQEQTKLYIILCSRLFYTSVIISCTSCGDPNRQVENHCCIPSDKFSGEKQLCKFIQVLC